jgi:hypothetical protein
MKYAEVTIHKEILHETMIEYCSRLFNGTPMKTTTTVIILFDDGTIVEAKECKCKILMGPLEFGTVIPMYFDINNKSVFSRSAQIFGITENILFEDKAVKDSKYNCRYYNMADNNDVFAITRIKSSDESPRFLVAYNSMFDQDHVIYLVNYILK